MGNKVLLIQPLLALGLVLWVAVGLRLARRAERSMFGTLGAPSIPTVLTALCVAALAVAIPATPAQAAARGIVCIALVIAADADARTGFIFDALTFPTAIAASAIALAFGNATACTAGVIALVGIFGTLTVASRGRLMGLGDVKAMFSIGAAFGPLGAIVAIFAACLSGTVAAALAGRLRRGESIRFGPHLATGSVLALAFADPIVRLLVGQ